MGLPNEIIVEILVRLPVKSVFRFKCVSKSWSNMISDDLFRHTYKSRRIAASCFLYQEAIRPNMANPLHFINTSKVENKEESLDLDFLYKLGNVIASSKGLILVRRGLLYSVCDLFTKKYVALPKLPNPGFYTNVIATGFICQEYQHINTSLRFKYKVVHIMCPSESFEVPSKTYVIETFSSETGKWNKSIIKAASKSFFPPWGDAKVIGGVFYWKGSGPSSHLVAYNPDDVEGRVKLIELPDRYLDENCYFRDIWETQEGELQCVRRRKGGYIEVLILKSNKGKDNCSFDDDVVKSSQWILVHQMGFRMLGFRVLRKPLPITINPLNPNELFFWMGKEILSYDRVSQKIIKLCDYEVRSWPTLRIYYELPVWPCLC